MSKLLISTVDDEVPALGQPARVMCPRLGNVWMHQVSPQPVVSRRMSSHRLSTGAEPLLSAIIPPVHILHSCYDDNEKEDLLRPTGTMLCGQPRQARSLRRPRRALHPVSQTSPGIGGRSHRSTTPDFRPPSAEPLGSFETRALGSDHEPTSGLAAARPGPVTEEGAGFP